MAVKDELTGCCTGGCDAETVYYVVKAGFKELEEHLTGNAFGACGFLEEVAELLFEYAVGVFSFLLFAELNAVF